MAYRNGNYCAFYVDESKATGNLGVNCAPDLCYYRELTAWYSKDSDFEFYDSHDKTYSVRDTSSWETLKQRLHERLANSKNIVLILSNITKESQALKEELEYGMHILKLPVIVVYPDFSKIGVVGLFDLKESVKNLWNNVPTFKKYQAEVPSLHIAFTKNDIHNALKNTDFMIQTATKPGIYK